LSGCQRHVLAAIQNELQADAELATAFSAFTSATVGAAMPKAERLPARSTLAGWRAFLKRRIMIVVAAVAALAAVLALALAASSAGRQTRCDPAYAFAPACHGPSWTPADVGGQLRASYPPPAYGHP
jgi:ferric-dicitrate binding protein FerR (iron transport regulator)